MLDAIGNWLALSKTIAGKLEKKQYTPFSQIHSYRLYINSYRILSLIKFTSYANNQCRREL